MTAYYDANCFIAKFNCAGQVVWHRVFGGSASGGGGADATGLTLDKFGNLYVTAEVFPDFTGHINYLDTSYLSNYSNSLILKLDTAGNRKWSWIPAADPSSFCAGAGVSIYSIRTDDSGYVYFTGMAYDSCQIFPGDSSNAPFLAKMDSLKNPVWFHNLGAKFPNNFFYNGNNHPRQFNVDGSGNCYFTRSFNDTISIDSIQVIPTGIIGTDDNLLVVKFDPLGSYLWHYSAGHQGRSTYCENITIDKVTNDVWVGAILGPGTPFGTDTVTNTYPTFAVTGAVHLSQGGNILGVYQSYNQFSPDNAVLEVIGSKAYFGSSFNGKVKIGNDSITSINSGDIFLAEVDIPSGQVHLVTSLQGTGSKEQPTVLGHDVAGNLYMGAAFDGTLSFNGNNIPYGGGTTDAFVAKWGSASCAPLSTGLIQDGAKLSLYPNPVNEQLTINNLSHPVYEYEIFNLLGKSIRHEYLNIRQNKIEVIVKNIPPGMYLLKITGESAIETLKFVKQ